jgi:hypothetical protein
MGVAVVVGVVMAVGAACTVDMFGLRINLFYIIVQTVHGGARIAGISLGDLGAKAREVIFEKGEVLGVEGAGLLLYELNEKLEVLDVSLDFISVLQRTLRTKRVVKGVAGVICES